jgi:purine-binding chemotaxis protein CheW
MVPVPSQRPDRPESDSGLGKVPGPQMEPSEQQWLLCRIGTRRCAIPLSVVAETMRAPRLMQLGDAEGLGVGAAIIHGETVPVVDSGALLGEDVAPRLLVRISVGHRSVAVLVDDVLGISSIAGEFADDLPPLLRGAVPDAVRAIDSRDGEFLLRLEASRLIPDALPEPLGDLGRGR